MQPTAVRTLADLDDEPAATVFDAPRTVRLHLDEGERLPPHSHPDRLILFVVFDGRFALDVGDETHVVQAGDVVRFDGRREVSPLAETDGTALLVLPERVDDD
jgi:quercetin dioxygenase-like cupin family protein